MNNRSLCFGVPFVLLSVAVGVFFSVYNNKYSNYEPPDTVLQQMRTNDIVFTVGHSWKSDIVRTSSTDNPYHYSHVGIVTIEEDNNIYVTHMSIDSGYIIRQPIDIFCRTNKVDDIGIYRIKESFDSIAFQNGIDSILKIRKKFDYSFSFEDDSEYYCTEFVLKTMYLAGVNRYQESWEGIIQPSKLASFRGLDPIIIPSNK